MYLASALRRARSRVANLEIMYGNLEYEIHLNSIDIGNIGGRISGSEGLLEVHDDRITALEAAPSGLGAPDFDTGWVAVYQGGSVATIEHGLGSIENVMAIMLGRMSNGNVHNLFYGGDTNSDESYGAYWVLEDTYLILNRRARAHVTVSCESLGKHNHNHNLFWS